MRVSRATDIYTCTRVHRRRVHVLVIVDRCRFTFFSPHSYVTIVILWNVVNNKQFSVSKRRDQCGQDASRNRRPHTEECIDIICDLNNFCSFVSISLLKYILFFSVIVIIGKRIFLNCNICASIDLSKLLCSFLIVSSIYNIKLYCISLWNFNGIH